MSYGADQAKQDKAARDRRKPTDLVASLPVSREERDAINAAIGEYAEGDFCSDREAHLLTAIRERMRDPR